MPNILIVFNFSFYQFLMEKVIRELLRRKQYNLFFYSRQKGVADEFESTFAGVEILAPETTHIVQRVKPGLILCCDEIWIEPYYSLFYAARANNIPVLSYDHGALYYDCEYTIEKDEYTTCYRSNVALASHVVCWGQKGKESWLSYGPKKEKFLVTGASHCDDLYKKGPSKEEIYSKLKIEPGKKILLFFACLHYHNLPVKWKERNWSILKKVVSFIKTNPHYQLVVKHHPMDVNQHPDPLSLYPENTVIICNQLEKILGLCRLNRFE